MKNNASLPVRIDKEDMQGLVSSSERMGLTVCCLSRLLIASFIGYYERQHGRIELPLQLKSFRTPFE